MRLETGDIVSTSYNSGPYRITRIDRGCNCPEYLKSLSGDRSASPRHIHLTCESLDGKQGPFYLSGYDDETLKSVWNNDFLIPLPGGGTPIQASLF